jgi:hypothetical protein
MQAAGQFSCGFAANSIRAPRLPKREAACAIFW